MFPPSASFTQCTCKGGAGHQDRVRNEKQISGSVGKAAAAGAEWRGEPELHHQPTHTHRKLSNQHVCNAIMRYSLPSGV